MYFKTFEKKECSGCTACQAACPKQCITMKADEEGFFYPVIDKSVCVECGLCEKVCPFDNPRYEHTEPQAYATYVKDENQRMQSTSGGIFYAIAKWIVEQGGIVYGAAFDECFKLRHIDVDTVEGLQQLRGSKYLQSDLQQTFSEIRQYLKGGRWVYFVGVGCQVAGLKSFLRKEYDTLVTSDLVCHGTPSQQMFDWHLDYLRQKEKGEIISYSFRDCRGWGVCETYEYVSQTRGKGICRLYSYELSPYLYSFMYAFNYRYSCYNCKFAKVPRQGDITLADYWGVRTFFPRMDTSKGVSLVLVNSEKGREVWEHVKDTLIYYLSCVEDAAVENGNLLHTTTMPEIRRRCYALIRERGYRSVAEKEFRPSHYCRVKLRVLLSQTLLWSLLRKIRNKIRNK